jgi:RNA polymerase sigma-70 factor (ECF subfamily)
MDIAGISEKARSAGRTDEEIVERMKSGDTALYEVVMRRYNQRLYCIARAILHDEDEAEDVMQAAYVRAYEHLHQFAGHASFSTWLTRIAVHEALAFSVVDLPHDSSDRASVLHPGHPRHPCLLRS